MNSLHTIKGRKRKYWIKKVLWRHIVGILVGSFSLFPLVWMISAAFDVTGQISTQQLFPVHRGLDNFVQLFSNREKPFVIWSRNSLVIATTAAGMQVVIGALAAYSLSRHRFRGRRVTLTTILIVQMFPQLLAATTLFLIINTLGKTFALLGLGQQLPLILIFGGSARRSSKNRWGWSISNFQEDYCPFGNAHLCGDILAFIYWHHQRIFDYFGNSWT
jgi:arabinogalactan oligomer/maltooligosaccharide transport system permease protein